MGASGVLPTVDYEIGSLFFEYDIEVQTAADNGDLGGEYSLLLAQTGIGISYNNSGSEATQTLSFQNARLITPDPPAQGNWRVDNSHGPLFNGIPLRVLWDGSRTYFYFPSPGVFLMEWVMQSFTPADVGTSAAGWTTNFLFGPTAQVLVANQPRTTTIASTSIALLMYSATVSIEEPEDDYISPGACNFTTTTASSQTTVHLRVTSLPAEAAYRLKKSLKKRKEEEKTVEDMEPQIEQLIARYLAKKALTDQIETPRSAWMRVTEEEDPDLLRLPAGKQPLREETKTKPALRALSLKS